MDLSDVYEKFKTPTFLTCPVCLDAFSDPRLLPCSHTVCSVCINGIVAHTSHNTRRAEISENQESSTSFCCPLCRLPISVSDLRLLPANRAITDVVDDWKLRVKKERCNWLKNLIKSCAKHNQNADVWCKTCNLNICACCAAPWATQDEPDNHLDHQFEFIPNFEGYCEDEASRLDEWIMVLPTVHEMFDIMKL